MKGVFKWLVSPAVLAAALRVLLAVGAAALAGLDPSVAAAAIVSGELGLKR